MLSPGVTRATAALLPAVGLAFLLAAVDPDPAIAQEGETVRVTLTNGEVHEGPLVEETEDRVEIQVSRFGTATFPKDEIESIERLGGGSGNGGSDPSDGGNGSSSGGSSGNGGTLRPSGGSSGAATYYVYRLTSGRIVRGRNPEDLGTQIRLEGDLGSFRIDKNEIADQWTEEVEAGEEPEPWVHRDYELGFLYTRPDESWQFVEPREPGARLEMEHVSERARFLVTVEPVPSGADGLASEEGLDALQDRWEDELDERYRRVSRLRAKVGDLFGASVYVLEYLAEYRVFESELRHREVRFFRGPVQYVLRASAPEDDFETIEPGLADLFAGFSFTGPVSIDGGQIVDHDLGYRMDLSDPSWTVYQPIGRDVVLRVLFPEAKRALSVSHFPGRSDPRAFARDEERRLRSDSDYYERTDLADGSVGGRQVVDLTYQDFSGGTRLHIFRSRYFEGGEGIVRIRASWPATSDDQAELADSIDSIYDSFRPLFPVDVQAIVAEAEEAVEVVTEAEGHLNANPVRPGPAIEALEGVIEAYPEFGRAYLLRGRAHEEAGEYRRAVSDYEEAVGRTMIGGVEERAVQTLLRYAEMLIEPEDEADRDLERGIQILERAARRTPENDDIPELMEEAYELRIEELVPRRGGDPDFRRGERVLREAFDTFEDSFPDHDHQTLTRAAEQYWRTRVDALLEEENYRRAERALRNARRMLGEDNRRVERLADRIQRERERSQR